MKSPTLPTTSKVAKAQQRLDRAVERLERALESRSKSTSRPAAEAEAIVRLEAENEALRATNHQVSQRLDATIGRLKRLLEA